MILDDEKQILKIIKYTPPFTILLVSIFVSVFLYFDYVHTLENEKNNIKEEYENQQKTIIKEHVQTTINHIQKEILKPY